RLDRTGWGRLRPARSTQAAYRSISSLRPGARAARGARRGPRAGPDAGIGRLRGELVHTVVPTVSRVPLDPAEGHANVAEQRECEQRLPQVAVRHRLVLRVLPAAALPSLPPGVGEALDHVGGVADHLDALRRRV